MEQKKIKDLAYLRLFARLAQNKARKLKCRLLVAWGDSKKEQLKPFEDFEEPPPYCLGGRRRNALFLALQEQNQQKAGGRGLCARGGRGGQRSGQIKGRIGMGQKTDPCLDCDQCAICKEKGHWKRECPVLTGEAPEKRVLWMKENQD